MLRLCLLRFKHQFALKTFSVGEVMTDAGPLDSQSVISLAVDGEMVVNKIRWEY